LCGSGLRPERPPSTRGDTRYRRRAPQVFPIIAPRTKPCRLCATAGPRPVLGHFAPFAASVISPLLLPALYLLPPKYRTREPSMYPSGVSAAREVLFKLALAGGPCPARQTQGTEIHPVLLQKVGTLKLTALLRYGPPTHTTLQCSGACLAAPLISRLVSPTVLAPPRRWPRVPRLQIILLWSPPLHQYRPNSCQPPVEWGRVKVALSTAVAFSCSFYCYFSLFFLAVGRGLASTVLPA